MGRDCASRARAAASKLQALLLWPEYLGDRHLDDAGGHKLAGLSAHTFGAAPWRGQLCRTDCCVPARPICRRVGGAAQSPQALVWTQALAAVQSLALAALTLAHVINLWEIIALTAMQGLINAFDMPGRQSFLVQMVEDRN